MSIFRVLRPAKLQTTEPWILWGLSMASTFLPDPMAFCFPFPFVFWRKRDHKRQEACSLARESYPHFNKEACTARESYPHFKKLVPRATHILTSRSLYRARILSSLQEACTARDSYLHFKKLVPRANHVLNKVEFSMVPFATWGSSVTSNYRKRGDGQH
jgi:hypothetical protein